MENILNFKDELHKERLSLLIKENGGIYEGDLERMSLFFLIAGNDVLFLHRQDLYDFEERAINIVTDEKKGWCIPSFAWQTSATAALTRLAFNLFNGFKDNLTNPMDILSSLDEKNFRLAMESIKIRFFSKLS